MSHLRTVQISLLLMVTSSWGFAQTVEQLSEKRRLQEKVASKKAASEQKLSEQVKVRDRLVEEQTQIQLALDEVTKKKERLSQALAQRQAQIEAYLETVRPERVNPYDTVSFTSGRSITCSLTAYEGGQFRLEDANGDSLYVLPDTVASIKLRSATEADTFPAHVVNQGPIQRTRVTPVTTMAAPVVLPMKDYMMNIDMKRSYSRRSADIIAGYADEVSSDVQYVCSIEPRGVTTDYENLRAKIWVFAEDVNTSGHLKLILHTSERFTLSPSQEVNIETDVAKLDFDDSGLAQYGFRLYGYLLIIEDEHGNVISTKRNRKVLEDQLKRVQKMSVGETVHL